MNNGWAKVKQAAKYAGVSDRTFRDWLQSGLKHSRLPTGTILIQYSDIDEFLNQFAVQGGDDADKVVDQILKDF